MSTIQKALIFFILPAIAPILFPPRTIMSGIVGIILVVGMFIVLGVLLTRGTMRALTLSIFLQGLNAIVRIMMFFPHVTSSAGVADVAYIITSLLSIGISSYLLVRMDRVDIRTLMIR